MKRISIIIMVIGISLLGYSFSLETYTDSAAYNEAYLSIDRNEVGREESFKLFHALRAEYLTHKYKYQDYGATFIIIGLFFYIFMRAGLGKFSAPNANWKIVMLGFSAGILTVEGYIGDLFLEFFRGSYPHWADSLGIPLMGMPIIAFIFIGWAAIHMLGLSGNFVAGENIGKMGIKGLNIWFSFISVATMLILILCIYDGFFWLVLPSLLWLYFYLSILAGRKSANKRLHSDAV